MSEYFRKNLKFLRVKKGLSQSQLAKRINKDRSSIAYWELGKSEPSIENVIKICQVLDVPIFDLTGKDLTIDSLQISRVQHLIRGECSFASAVLIACRCVCNGCLSHEIGSRPRIPFADKVVER